MKIIEALKELPMNAKKIGRNFALIEQYSSSLNGALMFATKEQQEQEIFSLVQANQDLVRRGAHLRRCLAYTNAQVTVNVGGCTRSIAEWQAYRSCGFDNLISTYSAMNDNKARTDSYDNRGTEFPQVTLFYDEGMKQHDLEVMYSQRDSLDAQLEIINATTDLIEL